MAGLFVMPENIWRELRRRKTETILHFGRRYNNKVIFYDIKSKQLRPTI